ncbi:MAG: hypothetical protein QM703_26950 [Gemmatales bacterium]
MHTPHIDRNSLNWQAHQQVLKAFIRQGIRRFELVSSYLHLLAKPDSPPLSSYPKWFFVELADALQIREWENQGLIQKLPVALPSSKSVIQTLIDKLRFRANNPQVEYVPDLELARKITSAYYLHFAHSSFELTGNFLVRQTDTHDFIGAIAQWLWKNRSNLS